MKRISTIAGFKRFRAGIKKKVVLVPTMGALHAGHAGLIQRARRQAGTKGVVVVSIFVNPTQFSPNEDFERYPRPIAQDLALCHSLGVDAVFTPTAKEIYAGSPSVFVDEQKLSSVLCGASRPGHFRGVCTVVAKLFLILQPSVAIFGEKDYQQLAIIRKMVHDLNFPVQILGVPTFREPDGLAMSSRNRYLSLEARAAASGIYAGLQAAFQRFKRGRTSASELRAGILERYAKLPDAKVDYVEIVHKDSLEPVGKASAASVIAVAVFFGKTRLIDNVQLSG